MLLRSLYTLLAAIALAATTPVSANDPSPTRKSLRDTKTDAPRRDPGSELSTWCAGIAAAHPRGQIPDCLSLRLTEGQGRSVKGVPLWSTDVTPSSASAPPLRVLVLGGIHGDEEASVTLVIDWIARARRETLARPVHWRMAPLVNPDGYFRSPRTRVNANGVDLNRNFQTRQWDTDAHKYWIKTTRRDPRRFPGPSALSEPESRWVHQQIHGFLPQLIVAVHAPYGVLDFDGPPPPPTRLGNLMLDQVGIYPGSLGNYGGTVLGVPVVTIELKHSSRMPATDAQAMWIDLQRWIDTHLLTASGTTRFGATRTLSPTTN